MEVVYSILFSFSRYQLIRLAREVYDEWALAGFPSEADSAHSLLLYQIFYTIEKECECADSRAEVASCGGLLPK